MTLCPIAVAIGCAKCPVFKICPVKSVIGDHAKAEPAATVEKPKAKKTAAAKKSAATKKKS